MKKGFTLIEVLIVLAILGIIAAFLINAVSKAGLKEQERNKYLLRKAYVSLSQNAENILSNRQNYPRGLLAQCRATNVDEDRQINFCDEFVSTINTVGDIQQGVCNEPGNPPTYAAQQHIGSESYEEDSGRIISSDRMVWWGLGGKTTPCDATNDTQLEDKQCDGSFGGINDPNACKIIVVDVNGTDIQRNSNREYVDKSKNIFGLDVFRFRLCNNGRVELIDDRLYKPYKSRQNGRLIDSARDLLRDANPTRVRNNRT